MPALMNKKPQTEQEAQEAVYNLVYDIFETNRLPTKLTQVNKMLYKATQAFIDKEAGETMNKLINPLIEQERIIYMRHPKTSAVILWPDTALEYLDEKNLDLLSAAEGLIKAGRL